MKKFLSMAICLILILSLFAGCGSTSNRENTLRIYNWEDYMDPDLLIEFEEYYEAKYNTDLVIVYDTFDTNETMLTKIEKGKEDYDVACPSDYIIEKMVKNDLVIPLDNSIIRESYNEYVPSFIQAQYAEITGNTDSTLYSVGYTWGTMGIMYNKEFVSMEDLESQGWGILWNDKYSNKIYMKDSMRDSVCVGNIYAHKDEYVSMQNDYKAGTITLEQYVADVQELFNRTDDQTLSKIQEALIEQKYTVNALYDVDNDKNAMVSGSAYLDVCWSGDAVWSIIEAMEADNGVELGYYIPTEATNLFFDGWVIPKYAKNVQAANEFVNFLIQPENAIRVMDYIGYTSVVASDEILEYAQDSAFEGETPVDASYFFDGQTDVVVNSAMYPDINVIHSSAIMRDYGENAEAVSLLWTEVKGNKLSPVVIVFIVILCLALIAVVVLSIVKGKNNKSKAKAKTTNKKKSTYRPD